MRHRISIVLAILLTAVVFALFGCGDDSTEPSAVFDTIALQPVRLPTLKSGLIYEGWVARLDEDSNWVEYQSFGKFFWDEDDYFFLSPGDTTQIIDSVFQIQGSVYDYDVVALTLESDPVDNNPAEPSPTVVASSPIVPDRFTLMRFPAEFTEAEGYFTIGTFSDGHYKEIGDSITNEYSGIWFLELSWSADASGTPVYEEYATGLTLPVLPDTGYLYEGWIKLNNGDTLSTGKFYLPEFQDYDNSHMLDGAIPNFPGEDFLANPPDGMQFPINILVGGQAFISIEPNPDNDLDQPSNLIVLRGNLPVADGEVRNSSFPMENIAALQFPRVNVYFLTD
ncbi:MAG: hypothetical protein KAT58_03990 [candidate division Zixibacteria bacterium]|nr:hypothetical protein [candidate division Zixibacteria bacterium]